MTGMGLENEQGQARGDRGVQKLEILSERIFWMSPEDDFDYNLHATGSLHATQTDINTDHNHKLTSKWKEMAAKVGN